MKPKCRIITVVVFTVVAVFFTVMDLSVTWAAEVPIYPTADTYVWQFKTDDNFGTWDSLSVSSHHNPQGSRNKRTLLKFDLSAISSNCTIERATLELYMTEAPGESRTHGLYFINDDSWREYEVTWNTQPAYDDVLLAEVSTGTDVTTLIWGSNDLTSKVSIEHTGDSIISFLLKDESEDNNTGNKEATFSSRENQEFAIPVLKVEYSCNSEEGCSHGFWKNHSESDRNEWPAGYTPNDLLTSYFDSAVLIDLGLSNDTLDIALDYHGGDELDGAARILLRNAVASLLNAAHEKVNYVWTVEEVKTKVDEALKSYERATMLALEEELDIYNNLCADLCPCTEE